MLLPVVIFAEVGMWTTREEIMRLSMFSASWDAVVGAASESTSNPKGANKNGHPVDGVLPDDQRRGRSFSWPAVQENYVWDALQGALAQAVILHRADDDAWNWEDCALLRAVKWLYDVNDYAATGDDSWQPHVINHYYGEHFSALIRAAAARTLVSPTGRMAPPLVAPRRLRLTRHFSTIESPAE